MNSKEIFKELDYTYKRPKYNITYLKEAILKRCKGNGTVLNEVLKMVQEYRDNLEMNY